MAEKEQEISDSLWGITDIEKSKRENNELKEEIEKLKKSLKLNITTKKEMNNLIEGIGKGELKVVQMEDSAFRVESTESNIKYKCPLCNTSIVNNTVIEIAKYYMEKGVHKVDNFHVEMDNYCFEIYLKKELNLN